MAQEQLKPWKPGQSGNPGGSTQGTRRKLQGRFLQELVKDFDAHGAEAIVECRINKPDQYLKVIASLMPQELTIESRLHDISDDDLLAGIAHLQSIIAAQRDAEGVGSATAAAAPAELSTLQ